MEVYAQPLNRVLYGQNKLFALHSSQRDLYFKYATIINTFLSGTTADILRMRLKQAAETNFMSLKNFLDCHKVNITPALKYSYNLLILVYPPHESSPDLAAWNTGLLCIVLRACNCLSVREQDDVIYITKVYRRYFNRRQLNTGSGVIMKKGHLAKREWIRTCSAVQRLVEVVDDAGLMKKVRNFICKVEIEEKTLKTRQDTQLRLASLLSEMATDNLLSKYRGENLTDEAKQIVKGQRSRQRSHSADARLGLRWTDEGNLHFDLKHRETNVSRPTTANKSDLSVSSRKRNKIDYHAVGYSSDRKGTLKEKLNSDKIQEVKLTDCKADARSEYHKFANKKKVRVGKRPLSATVRTTKTATTYLDKRPKSATNKQMTAEKKFQRSNAFKVNNTISQGEIYIRSSPDSARDNRQTARVLKVQWPSPQHAIKRSNENEKAKLEKNSRLSRADSIKGKQIRREHSKISFTGTLPSSIRRSISARSNTNTKKKVNGNSKQHVRDRVIRVPTAEPNSTELDDGGKHETIKCKESMMGTREMHKETDSKQGNANLEKQHDLDERKANNKRKVFDDGMKKIVNDVLVHQQIHEAVKNPLLQDKEFVDEFFSFLNENHVTKKFLRAQTTEPRQTWKLPDGKHVNFSFFMAFVFRHIENKDVNMVSYVVEKMLLQMRCKHSVQQKPRDIKHNTARSGHVDKDAGNIRPGIGKSSLSGKHENRSRSYKEFQSSMNNGHMLVDERQRMIARTRSVSRERSFTATEPAKRSRSASKNRPRTESGEVMPRLRHRSTSIADNQCWKCLQKDVALTACVNWSNRYLCDLLISEGVPYKGEHLSAAVKANDLVTLVKIVYYLRYNGIWNASDTDAKHALFLAKKHRMQKMVEFLSEEGVQDDRSVNHNACTPCFIA